MLRTPGPGPSPVLPRPMPTTVPDDAWPLDHRSIRCRDPTRKPILHIAPSASFVASLAGFGLLADRSACQLRRRCSMSPGHRFGSPRCGHLAGDRDSTVLAPAGKQYDVCLFPGRAEEQSPHVPRKTGNVLTAAWPIAINVMVACRPVRNHLEPTGGVHRHLGPRPRFERRVAIAAQNRSSSRRAESYGPGGATCSVQTDPTAVCVPS